MVLSQAWGGAVIIRRVVRVFKAEGLLGVLRATARRIRTPHARCFPKCKELVREARGIEIGGPSSMFASGGLIPVYPLARQIDNVNFAETTIWEDTTKHGNAFHFHRGKQPGQQFVAEGTDLSHLPAEKYDFVLSSHMLEHTANPLLAFQRWKRLLRDGGAMILVLPARDGTFDHRRPVTTMSHLLQDLQANMGEDDLTHLPEILELHDLSRDPGAPNAESFRERAARNPQVRSLHHHVFDTRLAVEAVLHAGFELISVEPLLPFHIVVLARSPLAGEPARPFDEKLFSIILQNSPFPSDRRACERESRAIGDRLR